MNTWNTKYILRLVISSYNPETTKLLLPLLFSFLLIQALLNDWPRTLVVDARQ